MAETPPRIVVRVQTEDFDMSVEAAALADVPNVGAVASFVGLCRDEDGRLKALELEHYPGMAEERLEAIARDAACRWPLGALTIVHRFGRIPAGEQIVVVLAASRHREASLNAVGFVMDYLKTDAPFWKKEWMHDGSSGTWVAAKNGDDQARERWRPALKGGTPEKG